jgi:hypothetical protein
MNRRDFLAGVTAALAASAIPPALAETVTARVPVLGFYSPDWLDVFKNLLEAYMSAFGGAPLPGTYEYEVLIVLTDSVFATHNSFQLMLDNYQLVTASSEELARVFGPKGWHDMVCGKSSGD